VSERITEADLIKLEQTYPEGYPGHSTMSLLVAEVRRLRGLITAWYEEPSSDLREAMGTLAAEARAIHEERGA
jgi:hypothetical protein